MNASASPPADADVVCDVAVSALLFAPLRRLLAGLPPHPGLLQLVALAEQQPVFTASGQRIRFVDPRRDGLSYEERVWLKGEVATRRDDWHDFFNGLVWLTFPQAKAAINAAHYAAMTSETAPHAGRGPRRDALTHFDECGVVVLASRADLLQLLRDGCWRELFVTHRAAVRAAMRFLVFGHATYQALLAPFRGLTGKAVLYQVSEDFLQRSLGEQMREIDLRLAADLVGASYARPRDFQPLPLLGIPGVVPESESPDYYNDAQHFRKRGPVP